MPPVPHAERIASVRRFHGDAFLDHFAWMSHKDSPEVHHFVAEENRYCEARMAPLAGLRRTLFDEFKSHVQETDMSVPTRIDGYWYYTRTQEGKQYAVQCRLPIAGPDDWDPPAIDAADEPGAMPGEQIVFDMNKEAEGHDFFRVGGMDLSKDGRWLLYGIDTSGDERYDFRIRDLSCGQELPDRFDGLASACLTPDAKWVFTTELDDAWRPFRVRRHEVGTPVSSDVTVFEEQDEKFWVGVGLSFDERHVVIGTGSKTTTEVRMLPVDDPTGEFSVFIPRKEGVEYDVSFASFEGAGPDGADIPLAIVYHNAANPNFEIDIINMLETKPPYRLGDGVRIAQGSPYGCELGDAVIRGASGKPAGTPCHIDGNPEALQGARGLAIEGIAMHRHFVALSYRADALPRLAVMTKEAAAQDFLSGRPWRFQPVEPPALEGDWDGAHHQTEGEASASGSPERNVCSDATVTSAVNAGDEANVDSDATVDADTAALAACGMPVEGPARLYSIGAGGNPSYEAPRMRYSFSSFTRPGELHELDPATGADRLLKRAKVLGDFDPRNYREARLWVTARDGEQIPVSLVWRAGENLKQMPLFILGYGAYEISSDPGFSVARLSLLDRGVLYALPHIRGGGEMGRAWYEQGRRFNKKHTFEDFVDATAALQRAGFADRKRTVANGGSAGGLLMGAVANMAPELYAGIEADVPFVDALTTILDPSLPLTVTEWDEWGDPLHDAETYRYMQTYSPYENAPLPADLLPRTLRESLSRTSSTGSSAGSGASASSEAATSSSPANSGASTEPNAVADCDTSAGSGSSADSAASAYPAASADSPAEAPSEPSYCWPDGHVTHYFPKIFVTTSMNDTRVMVAEPLKWVARLQAAGVDAVIRIEVEAGHGGISGRYKQWEQVSYENAWCLSTMGISQ